MHFFSPTRPKFADRPLFALPSGEPLSESVGLPLPHIIPLETGEWLIEVLMPRAANAFSWCSATFASSTEVASFLDRWREDPELELSTTFGYRWQDYKVPKEPLRNRPSRPRPTIEDLL